jgi:pilus assembly protein FimV
MKKTIFSTIVIAIIATVTSRVWALELGSLTVYSEFNEPFFAEIALLQAHGTLEEGLHVGLASEDEFAGAELARAPFLADVSFVVESTEDASRILLVSRTPLPEPVFQFILEARWSEGRLLRQYAVSMDGAPKALSEPLLSDDRAFVKSEEANSDAAAVAEMDPQHDEALADRPVAGGHYLVTKSDTLWQIASSIAEPGISVEQTMLAIVSANPAAFLDGNVNGLMSGYVLELPGGENISVDLPGALDAVSKQNAAWTDNTTFEQQGLTLVANGEPIPVEITRPTASVEQPVPVEADLASDLPLVEPKSSPIASVQAAVGRSELDALSATVGELQAVVAQLQSQLTERDLQLAELRAVILGAPVEPATFPMRLLAFLSEPVWVFVTGCVAIASVLLTLIATRRRRGGASQSGDDQRAVLIEATEADDASSRDQALGPDAFTKEAGQSVGRAGPSAAGLTSGDKPSARADTLSELSETSGEPASADTTSSLDSIYGVETDPTDSKLDLARAYIDMGDDDGARPVLHEVIKQGDYSQQAEAVELLRRIEAR